MTLGVKVRIVAWELVLVAKHDVSHQGMCPEQTQNHTRPTEKHKLHSCLATRTSSIDFGTTFILEVALCRSPWCSLHVNFI
jgi:hypothetical protein